VGQGGPGRALCARAWRARLTAGRAGGRQAEHPCVLEKFGAFLEAARGRRVAVFLDYDGTLTPIVKNPDRAYMSDQARRPGPRPPARLRLLCKRRLVLCRA
jgi:hypothetical protein